MEVRSVRRHLAVWSAIGISLGANSLANAQQVPTVAKASNSTLVSTRSILEDTGSLLELSSDSTDDAKTLAVPPAKQPLATPEVELGETELVQQLYPNGSLRVSKHVKLDSKGNFVNHGEYQEWSENGQVLVSGNYELGKQDGVWTRFCTAKDSKLFQSEPYSKFKAPFQSTVEFADGKMNGVWMIIDKDGKKISEIQLIDGRRNGLATWYHPSGSILWQSEYKDGQLNGMFVEKDANGKSVRSTAYINGQKSDTSTEYFPSKKPKAQFQILSAGQSLLTPDDWNTSTIATYEIKGQEVKHGTAVHYHESGVVRSQSNYKNGVLDGEFASWYANNQRESVGRYVDGKQHGKWNWWHENGMRKCVATFENGELVEPAMSWNDQGQRVESSELNVPRPVPEIKTDDQTTSRSATSIRSLKK